MLLRAFERKGDGGSVLLTLEAEGREVSRMGFLSGLILGIAFGIGVVVVFVRSENSRSKIRRDLVRDCFSFFVAFSGMISFYLSG